MGRFKSLCHLKWDCKHPTVFIPKYKKKKLYGKARKHLGSLFHDLSKHKGSEILEGHICVDHIHMYISIPPKYTVSHVMRIFQRHWPIHFATYHTPLGAKRRFFIH